MWYYIAQGSQDRKLQVLEDFCLTSHSKLSGSKQQPCISYTYRSPGQFVGLKPLLRVQSAGRLFAHRLFTNGFSRIQTTQRSQFSSKLSSCLSVSWPRFILMGVARRASPLMTKFGISIHVAHCMVLVKVSHPSAQIQGAGKWTLPLDEKIFKGTLQRD